MFNKRDHNTHQTHPHIPAITASTVWNRGSKLCSLCCFHVCFHFLTPTILIWCTHERTLRFHFKKIQKHWIYKTYRHHKKQYKFCINVPRDVKYAIPCFKVLTLSWFPILSCALFHPLIVSSFSGFLHCQKKSDIFFFFPLICWGHLFRLWDETTVT